MAATKSGIDRFPHAQQALLDADARDAEYERNSAAVIAALPCNIKAGLADFIEEVVDLASYDAGVRGEANWSIKEIDVLNAIALVVSKNIQEISKDKGE